LRRSSKGVVFRRIEGGRLKIAKEPLLILETFIQDENKKKEAGGVLLGRMIKNRKDIVIDSVSTPQKKDKRKRTFFKRNNEHQTIINEEWEKSDGTCNYLGEWHTHPEAIPSPSGVDLKNWKKQLRNAKYEGDTLFFIIVGIKEIVAYEGSNSNLKIQELVKYE